MKEIKPPRHAQKLFDWFCKDAAVEDLRGDMEELFYANLERMSGRKAKLKYWVHTASLVTSYAVKKRKQPSTHSFSSTEHTMDMLKNYFVTAGRNLVKNKFFTIINVLGLAIGMSISLLFIALISYVTTYDNFHVNKDRIYRVITKTNIRNNWQFASVPVPLGEKMRAEFAGLEEVVRINSNLRTQADYNNKEISLGGYFVDPNFLKVFTFPLLSGNKETALKKPHSVLITESGASRMFNTEDPIGKVIRLGEFGEFEVTGVLKDLPKNSHMVFEILVPHEALDIFERSQNLMPANRWKEFETSYVYALFPSSDPSHYKNEINSLTTYLDRVAKGAYAKEEEFKGSFALQAFTDIVPGVEVRRALGIEWEYSGFVVFGILTLLILLPACFNYTNISISRALKRSKEIGLRKVVGGQSSQIFSQFIMETVLVTLIALVGAYFIFGIVRDEFTSMLVASQHLDLNPTPATWLYFLGFAIFVGFVAGVVPARYFSKLNPIQALKSKSSSNVSIGSSLRKGLVVLQFALSLGFIMAVAITVRQHYALLNYNFGFEQENILDVDLQGMDPEIFKNEFSKISSVQTISMSSGVMGFMYPQSAWMQKTTEKDSLEIFQMFVDNNYISNLNLKLLAGRTFSELPEANKQYVVVNEEFLNQLKIDNPIDALDKSFIVPNTNPNTMGQDQQVELRILGVVKDFHFMDLRQPIRSFCFRYDPGQFNYANLKIISTDMPATLGQMEAVWRTFAGDRKFESKFFDDEIEEAYFTFSGLIEICGFLGLLAISISCLGLLGMVVYTSELRTKEIGIRKVMGASSTMITVLISKDYVKLMLIAAAIAIPITYLIFDLLILGSQYYKIKIGVLEIIASLLLMLLLGVSTILSQTLKATKANPADTLRYE